MVDIDADVDWSTSVSERSPLDGGQQELPADAESNVGRQPIQTLQQVPQQSQTMEQLPPTHRIDPESAKIIADLAAKVFADESDRVKSVDDKTGILIAASGAGLLFLIGAVAKKPDWPDAMQPWLVGIYFGVIAITIGLVLVAEVYFLLSLTSRSYQGFDLEKWVTWDFLAMPAPELLAMIAATYRLGEQGKSHATLEKGKLQQTGLWWLLAGIFVLGGGMLVVVVVSLLQVYVAR